MLPRITEGTAALIGMLVIAFPGLTLLRVASRRKSNVVRGLLVLIGSGLTVLAAGWFSFGLFLSVFVDADWAGTIGFLSAAALIFIVFRSRKPPVPDTGHCRQCGYDLTGNTSGICPECGQKTEFNTNPVQVVALSSPP